MTTMEYRNISKMLVCLAALTLFGIGCGPGSHDHAGHDHGSAGSSHAGHHHDPPHGGTPIRLGDELYHLEFVKDETKGVMQCFVLDGHMEQFIRIQQTSIDVLIHRPDASPLKWTFQAVENRATGESVGNTSAFEAPLEELPDQNSFDGIIQAVHILGNQFSDVEFLFPEGNESH